MNNISSDGREINDKIQVDIHSICAIQTSNPQPYVQPEELAHKCLLEK
jgi:hypothetical protein